MKWIQQKTAQKGISQRNGIKRFFEGEHIVHVGTFEIDFKK